MVCYRTPLPLVGMAVALLVGCNALTEDAAPTKPTPVTLAPIAIPVVLPATPAATPTPTPAPHPSPTPTPASTPPPSSWPVAGSCSLPPSNPPNPTCGTGTPSFLNELESAITQATQEHPELFDLNDKKCDNCYRVKDINRYIIEVMNNVTAQRLCTLFDGEDFQIKQTNDFNDGYDIITSSSYIRRGSGSYRGTCHPSGF
jgi:hypothetical protein